LAFQDNAAAHGLAEFLCNGQSEAGSAKLSGGRSISLREWLKQARYLFVGETNPGVPDSKQQ